MVDRYHRWRERKLAERCAQNLKRNGFDVHIATSPESGIREILGMISDFETFGFGGSETLRQMGLIEELRGMGKTIFAVVGMFGCCSLYTMPKFHGHFVPLTHWPPTRGVSAV